MAHRDPHSHSAHALDCQGNPAGGINHGTGYAICWQDGPIGEGHNGAFTEHLLEALIDRHQFYQSTDWRDDYNARLIEKLQEALAICDARTSDRARRQVLGTNRK